MSLSWDDADEIAYRLAHAQPEIDPMSLRFIDLHKWIIELPEFDGDANASNESFLEAIQMAWYDEWRDMREP
jgi:FeS assembly protein IscX